MNTLSLRKCAYIFDNSHNNFFYGTKEQHAIKAETEKALKEYYSSSEKRQEKIEYCKDTNGNFIITINNHPHILNDIQIAAVHDDDDNIINHRKVIDINDIANIVKDIPSFYVFINNSLYNRKYKTMYFEFYTEAESLGYIRAHFNGRHEQFIIDARNGDIYTSGENGKHKLITIDFIIKRLNISSEKAIEEFNKVINKILEV